MAEFVNCEHCGVEIERFRENDTEALAEFHALFPDCPESRRMLVCDDCYQLGLRRRAIDEAVRLMNEWRQRASRN